MRSLRYILGAMLLCSPLVLSATATAGVKAVIDKSEQTMSVSQNGTHLYTWKVSTGKKLRWTHNGTFGMQSMDADHFSSRYNNAAMPHSVFYDGNRAIHGTDKVWRLGYQDSMGCVRLSRQNAKIFFNLVLKNPNVVIVIKN